MDSGMGHLCNLRILMAAVKNDNFQLKYFVLCFLFLLRTYIVDTRWSKNKKNVYPC